jgi:UDP-N-acetyl-2-amino-2-deoxyglucuronate dehydrogenase
MKNFAITGVAGYIAPRHLSAIKVTGNRILAAVDPHDSVGILDSFFPDASFFTEFERFDRHLEKLRRGPVENHIDYLTICSPNHLHDAHIRLALRIGANAICEKPLVINPWNLDALQVLEEETSRKVYTVLQLRLHPSLIELKNKLVKLKKKANVVLTYITSRGIWYDYSWKGIEEKSGGIATNIGIHFFDLLIWLFGSMQKIELHLNEKKKAGGFIELENAYVQWFLSIERNDLPAGELEKGHLTYRSLTIDGKEIKFSDGFTELHNRVYEETLAGKGFGINDARPSIELVHKIRKSPVEQNSLSDNPLHYLTKKNLKK